jgi:hypothetical protein
VFFQIKKDILRALDHPLFFSLLLPLHVAAAS